MCMLTGKWKMSKLITEYKDWVDEDALRNLWGSTVCQGHWKFGQKSNDDTVYPMWFQTFFHTFQQEYMEPVNEVAKEIGDRFLEICGKDYTLVRNMLAGNTFGQDGDVHDDWPNLEESLTGVLYLNRNWNDNWGGETIVYDKNNLDYCEISKFQAGKLIVFDGANPHIGKGPQRACGELRSIIAVQAVKTDEWKKLLDSKKQK